MERNIISGTEAEILTLLHRALKLDQNMNNAAKYPEFSKLSVNEISVIDAVAKNPDVILKEICTSLELPKSTLTNIINRLEKKGFLNRKISIKDLRSYGLDLTAKGKQAQEEHVTYETMYFCKVLSALNEDDKQHLVDIMHKIIHTMEEDLN